MAGTTTENPGFSFVMSDHGSVIAPNSSKNKNQDLLDSSLLTINLFFIYLYYESIEEMAGDLQIQTKLNLENLFKKPECVFKPEVSQ